MTNIIPVDAKLTQTAGFFKIELSLFSDFLGGTTIGEVCGGIVVILLLHRSPLQQQKNTDCDVNDPEHSDWLQSFECSQHP